MRRDQIDRNLKKASPAQRAGLFAALRALTGCYAPLVVMTAPQLRPEPLAAPALPDPDVIDVPFRVEE